MKKSIIALALIVLTSISGIALARGGMGGGHGGGGHMGGGHMGAPIPCFSKTPPGLGCSAATLGSSFTVSSVLMQTRGTASSGLRTDAGKSER